MNSSVESDFQQLCHDRQLAVTHQRLVVYRTLMQMRDHPSPDQVFARVRSELPSISLATVYKTVNLFLTTGIIREVSPHHGTLRIEPNLKRHFHFICLQCHLITDLPASAVDESPLKKSVPEGFEIEEISMEVRGLCSECAERRRSSAHA